MNQVLHQFDDKPGCVELVRDAVELSRFRQPDCAAAIWQRDLPTGAAEWLAGLDADVLPSGRVIVAPDMVKDTVRYLCDQSGLENSAERDWLLGDIASMAQLFSALMGVKSLRLRLDVVSTNACRKFHVDALTARLVCTYRGTGTQYGVSQSRDDPETVFTVPTGSPILLHGSLRPRASYNCLLHRSPPIEGTGETRLVLVIDPVFDPEDAL